MFPSRGRSLVNQWKSLEMLFRGMSVDFSFTLCLILVPHSFYSCSFPESVH